MSSRNTSGFKFRIVAPFLLAALTAPLTAQEHVNDSETTEAQMAEEAPIVENSGSPGMSIPFDGDTIDSFEESLEQIRAETTDAEFTTLQNALDYLLVYDLGARRNRELLYQRLDGKTPTDVLGMVKWRLEGRQPERPQRNDG